MRLCSLQRTDRRRTGPVAIASPSGEANLVARGTKGDVPAGRIAILPRLPRKDRLAAVRTRGVQMPNARLANAADLTSLLELYRVSEVSPSAEPQERAERIWSGMLSHAGVAVFVSDADAKIVATCMLITAPNLLRAGRQHGFLENVVTHPDFRRRGHGRAVVHAALAAAWANDCYHVLLQSGRSDPGVHRFYERCGFQPGLRIGYVARRPTMS